MSKTQADYQREYRARKKLTQESNAPDTNAPELLVSNAPTSEPKASGPLSVYSPARWAYLQEHKHVWDESKQRGVRPDGIIGGTVPGDPGYSETDTTQGDDLPADVLAEIERMCSESNNGERASSHGRVAMVERAMRYQEACGKR